MTISCKPTIERYNMTYIGIQRLLSQTDNLINNAIPNDKGTHYGKSLPEEEYTKPLKETYPYVSCQKISFIIRKRG